VIVADRTTRSSPEQVIPELPPQHSTTPAARKRSRGVPNSRRSFLLSLLIGTALLLTACPQTEPAVVETIVRETVVVEVEKIVEVTREIEKIVEVTREVERIVEVIVTPTPAATPAPPLEKEPVTLRVGLANQSITLDPALAADAISIDLLRNLYAGLTQVAPDGQVLPMLATGWEISEDRRQYTFKLRQDGVWVKHDPGTDTVSRMRPITAQDVVFGVKRSLDPRTAADYAYVLDVIQGAEALRLSDIDGLSSEEQQTLLDNVGIEALDDGTVRITLESPAPYFPAIASMWVMRPMPQEPIVASGDRWIEPGLYWSSGPMVLREWERDDHILLDKNPYWWRADGVQIDRLHGVIVTEPTTTLTLYQAGDLDVMQPSLSQVGLVQRDPLLSRQFRIAQRDCTYYYGFTIHRYPVDNSLVRRALSAAIDRQSLIETVTPGTYLPANTYAPEMIFGNAVAEPSIAPWALDYELGREEARAWLAEAGYPGGLGFPTITLLHNASEGHRRIAEAVASMWHDVLGIDVIVQSRQSVVYVQSPDWDDAPQDLPHVWQSGHCADYPDQHDWLYETFHAQEGANGQGAASTEFEDLIETAELETDPAVRWALYQEAERILVDEEARMIPIFYYTTLSLTQPWVTYRTFSETGGTSFFQWRIDGEARKSALGT